MSKVFIPQFAPPSPDPHSGFVSENREKAAPALSLQWPQIQSAAEEAARARFLKEQEETILKRAREKALAVEREAYEKGFAQGERDGIRLSEKTIEGLLESLRGVIADLNQQCRELGEEIERGMIRLVFTVLRKILHREDLIPESAVKESLNAAFHRIVDPRKVTVRVNPKDHQFILSCPGDLPWKEEAGGVRVVPDDSIARGGCVLETPFGEVDATLDGQLDQILSLVEDRLNPTGAPTPRPEP